jgi:hypothetical protein
MLPTKHLLDPVPIVFGSQGQERGMVVTANIIWVKAKRAPVERIPGLEIVLHRTKCTTRMFHLLVDAAMHSMVSATTSEEQSQPSVLVQVSEPII